LFTRENFVCFDGLPYDYRAVRNAWFAKNAGKWGQGGIWVPHEGPEGDGASELAHIEFDELAGIEPARRNREDRLPRHLFATIEKWLVDSDADDLAKWSHVYLAHGGDPLSREQIAHLTVTANKIENAIKVLARATEATATLVVGGRAGALMPTAQFNQFEKLEQPIMRVGDEKAARDRWDQHSAEWDRCLDVVGDDLIAPSPDKRRRPKPPSSI
jgi:hypothetical protein